MPNPSGINPAPSEPTHPRECPPPCDSRDSNYPWPDPADCYYGGSHPADTPTDADIDREIGWR